ncbi:MAG: DNRLRE domain-containing protein, partial [Spirochaetes bacterium]|nr:DNRLRE domain-containing protein [Spirochaetota bacterium]
FFIFFKLLLLGSFVFANYNTKIADLLIDNIFVLGDDEYAGTVSVTENYQFIELDVTGLINNNYSTADSISFLLMGRYKGESAAYFYSKERNIADEFKPTLKIDNSINILASDDTYILGGEANLSTNFGSDTGLMIKASGAPFDNTTRKTYIKFDISNITNNVSSAKLVLYGKKINSAEPGDYKIMVFKADNNIWNENDLKWENHNGTTITFPRTENAVSWLIPGYYENSSWDKGYSVNNRSFLTRFYFMDVLLRADKEENNDAYITHLLQLIEDFIIDTTNSTNPNINDAIYHTCFDTSFRVNRWLKLYDHTSDNYTFSHELLDSILKENLILIANLLANVPDYFQPNDNWGFLECSALYNISQQYDELDYSNLAKSRISNMVDNLIFDDGGYIEGSTGYSSVSLYFLYQLIHELQFPDSEIRDSIEKLAKFIMDVSYPNGIDTQIGDAGYCITRGLVNQIGQYYNNQILKYFGTDGLQGTKPEYTSILYPDHKTAVMKTGWDETDTYMLISNHTGVMGHPSLLSVVAYADNNRLLIDSGRYMYASDTTTESQMSIINQIRFSTEAHNTIEINNKAQGSADKFIEVGTSIIGYDESEKSQQKIHDWTATKIFDFYEGSTNANEGFLHYRNVFFNKYANFWIVSDYIDAGQSVEENVYRQSWHFLPEANIELNVNSKRIETNFTSGANLQVIPADPETFVNTSIYGEEPIIRDGYYSEYLNQYQDAKYGTYTKQKTGNVSFDTVLYPKDVSSTGKISIERLSVSSLSSATALKVISSDAADDIGYYFLSHEDKITANENIVYEETIFDDYQFSGKLSFIQTDIADEIRFASLVDASCLKKDNIILIDSAKQIPNIGVVWDNNELKIFGDNLIVADDNPLNGIAIWAPNATSVSLNGENINYTQSGDYIYAVQQKAFYVPDHHISADGKGDLGVRFVDFDHDGTDDMIYYRYGVDGDPNNHQIGAYRNTGNGWALADQKFFPPWHISADGKGDLGVRFVDFDHDGTDD